MHGPRNALSFIDDLTRLALAEYSMKYSDALLKFKEFVEEHGAPTCLQTDKEGECLSKAFRRFLENPR